jgi:hypothetical protein
MSDYGKLMTRSAQAAADLRTHQYHFLRAPAVGTVNVASEAAGGANDLIGVLQNKPNVNDHATIMFFGESKIIAGGAVTANTFITTNGSGRAAAADSGDMAAGLALETATTDGEVIRAQIFPPYLLLRV